MEPSTIDTTAAIGPVTAAVRDWVPAHLHRLSLDEYEAMVAADVFGDKGHLHLLNGCLVEKMTPKPPHSTADELCSQVLSRVVPAGWHTRAAKPIRLPPNSMPEPDRSVVRGEIRDYSSRDPGPRDIGLVIEVSDRSLDDDRKQAVIYGASGIAVYWLINLVDRRIEVFASPTASGYATQVHYLPGQSVPFKLDGVELAVIPVDSLLP